MKEDIAYNTLLEMVPPKEVSRFKALLANYNTITMKTKLQEEWMYVPDWDFIVAPTERVKLIAKDYPEKLSPHMYVYENLVVFIEKKGINGWANPCVTLLSLEKGFIKY